jgi:hypothetical protein
VPAFDGGAETRRAASSARPAMPQGSAAVAREMGILWGSNPTLTERVLRALSTRLHIYVSRLDKVAWLWPVSQTTRKISGGKWGIEI